MSAEDYDQCEKLFCGSWTTTSKDENVEEFMTAAGMSEQMKVFTRQENEFTIKRVGNSFLEKATVGAVAFEMTLKINEMLEFKEKEENPVFHVKTIATFKDGVWTQEITPLNEGGGKKRVMKSYIQGDELVVEFTVPDVPGFTAKRTFKKS